MTARHKPDAVIGKEFPPSPSTEATSRQIDRVGDTARRVKDGGTTLPAERGLQRVVEHLKRAEHIAKLGSWEWDLPEGKVTWSDELYRIFGLEPGSWVPSESGFLSRVHPDDVSAVSSALFLARSAGRPYHIEYRINLPGGSTRTMESRVEVQLGADGRPERVMGTVDDVTERKAAERALLDSREQLRNLAERLAAVREEERTRISREIHDELGQALTALKFDLAWLRSRSQGEALERLDAMSSLLDGTASAVRRISNDLRPGILDDLGLAAAIGWQAEQFGARTGIDCRARILAESCDLDEGRSTTLFRALQEALTNVARHAHAHRVTIVLQCRRGVVELCVADDGRGIAPADPARPGGLGLIGIGERARACGGVMSIARRRRRGTVLTVCLPLPGEDEVRRGS